MIIQCIRIEKHTYIAMIQTYKVIKSSVILNYIHIGEEVGFWTIRLGTNGSKSGTLCRILLVKAMLFAFDMSLSELVCRNIGTFSGLM